MGGEQLWGRTGFTFYSLVFFYLINITTASIQVYTNLFLTKLKLIQVCLSMRKQFLTLGNHGHVVKLIIKEDTVESRLFEPALIRTDFHFLGFIL